MQHLLLIGVSTVGIMRKFRLQLQWSLVKVIIILGLFAENATPAVKAQE